MIEAQILFLNSDPEMSEYLKNLLEGEGYVVSCYTDISSFSIALEQQDFDLILMDIEGKGINGTEICREIRANFMLKSIPIIILVEKKHTIEKIKGIYAGADDYIEKPIQAGELLTRIKANLWRAKRDLDANPLTKLPGNASILKEIEKCIKNKDLFCMGYVDLDKFKEYNDFYGFEYGDKLIKHSASLIYGALKELGSTKDFLGHIGGDDFLFITALDSIESICKKIIYDFDASIPSFYKEEERNRGHIITKDRKGILAEIPFITITIGVATNRQRKITHTGQMIQIATELKHYGKTFPKSIYLIDRRKD